MKVKINGESSIGAHKSAFIERWSSYRVATIDRFHCSIVYVLGMNPAVELFSKSF